MKKVLFLIFLALCSCVSPLSSDSDVISRFSQVDKNVDRRVTARGYISQTQGAAGLYFSLEDLDDQNDKCVLPQDFAGFTHGERAIVEGVLRKTDCSTERVCINVCDRYTLNTAPQTTSELR